MYKNHLQVSDMGEKKLIKRIIEKSMNFNTENSYNNHENYSKKNPDFNQYIGDDAALIDFNINNKNSEERYLVATSDLLIQKSHFPKQMSYFQMGWKAVVVNVSDLAAMGAAPLGILISLAVPNNLKLSYFDEIIDGILASSNEYNIPLLGGDTNQADQIIISGTALGVVEKAKAMKKSGFKDMDLIAITGEVGLAALGFEILKEENIKVIKDSVKNDEISREIVDLAIEKALKPRAKLEDGIIMNQFASSATDITDGLASELYECYNADKIANKDSNLGIRICAEKITNTWFFKEIAKVSKILNKNPLDLVLHVGEDFELLFTFDENMVNNHSIDFIVIGEINNSNKVEIEYSNGKVEDLSPKGYEHLSKKSLDSEI